MPGRRQTNVTMDRSSGKRWDCDCLTKHESDLSNDGWKKSMFWINERARVRRYKRVREWNCESDIS